ncbi:hypothetical protein BC835DRAFT_487093 [Cytidiella melzeri]|nr:hypothetical protein BC835DRAFT_487093 [Cytidiella melzeri]
MPTPELYTPRPPLFALYRHRPPPNVHRVYCQRNFGHSGKYTRSHPTPPPTFYIFSHSPPFSDSLARSPSLQPPPSIGRCLHCLSSHTEPPLPLTRSEQRHGYQLSRYRFSMDSRASCRLYKGLVFICPSCGFGNESLRSTPVPPKHKNKNTKTPRFQRTLVD